MIVPVRCDRCRQTAEEAGTEILTGLCGNCYDELRDEMKAYNDQIRDGQFEPAGVGYTEDF